MKQSCSHYPNKGWGEAETRSAVGKNDAQGAKVIYHSVARVFPVHGQYFEYRGFHIHLQGGRFAGNFAML
ncbi:MAG: hypothetical protein RBG13Loki_0859 [Promethearchaeota archaeon CR_4]|nr:MAG: hypothetical protein RBG13Loki_0859 [Candidatus Lokiarchaeota archaeon CR_4]